jgi:hypothetical protein
MVFGENMNIHLIILILLLALTYSQTVITQSSSTIDEEEGLDIKINKQTFIHSVFENGEKTHLIP